MHIECLSIEAFTEKLEQDRKLWPFINKAPLEMIFWEIKKEIDRLNIPDSSDQQSCYIVSKIGAEILTDKGFFCQKIIAFGENLNIRTNDVEWANHQAIIIKVVEGEGRNRFITNYIVDPIVNKFAPMPFDRWTLELANLSSFDSRNDVLIYYEIFPHFFAKPAKFSFDTQFDTCRYTYMDKGLHNIDPNFLLNPNSLIRAAKFE